MSKTNILGISVDAQRFEDALNTLCNWLAESQPRMICTCTTYTIMMAGEQPAVFQALSRADMITADGMPLVWIQHRRGVPFAKRVYGPDLMLALCQRTAETNYHHFFLGGLSGVAEQLSRVLQARYPALKISGCYTPPFASVDELPNQALVEHLNNLPIDILWVGLGSPKQDLWMSVYRPVLRARLLIGVGAAFDFVAGVKPQAPPWMQRSGLEWLFRLVQEPRRLGIRYLIYNPRFIFKVLWHQAWRVK